MIKDNSYKKYLDFIKNNDNINKVIILIKLLNIGTAEYKLDETFKYIYLVIELDVYCEIIIFYRKDNISFDITGLRMVNIFQKSLDKYDIKLGNFWRRAEENLKYEVINDFFEKVLKTISEKGVCDE